MVGIVGFEKVPTVKNSGMFFYIADGRAVLGALAGRTQ